MKRFHFYLPTLAGIFFLLLNFGVSAQSGSVEGTISDASGPMFGAAVVIQGTTNGSITDFTGQYSIKAEPGEYKLEVTSLGYSTMIRSVTIEAGKIFNLDFLMSEGMQVDELVVIGTRSGVNRTKLETPVPVDVIEVSKLTSTAAQTNLNSLLHNTVPSFSSNTQMISDGTDHIDPASLRGLGPDQVLVLINEKRRHTTSLVNVNGTFGRGNVGTDLNAIPVSAVEAIDILRDGAAAQYGSDAIAGVINLRLRRDVKKLNFTINTGANFTSEIGAFEGEEKSMDGENLLVGVNYGLLIGSKGGYINLTGEYTSRSPFNRMQEWEGSIFSAYNGLERVATAQGDFENLTLAKVQDYAGQVGYFSGAEINEINAATSLSDLTGILGADVTDDELLARGQQRSDYNMRVGQSKTDGAQFFANMSVPIGENLEFYSFGGAGYRNGESGCFYRLPNQSRTSTSVYADGTLPLINSEINDKSIAAGIKGKVGEWTIDFSNVYGDNKFQYNMTQTHNATLGRTSPTSFDVGGHKFSQNTTNIDLGQYYNDIGSLKGINLAFGAEYRVENYTINPGEPQSYENSNIDTMDILGRARPSGAQCFAGFLPENAVDENRSSVAGYVDAEFDFSDRALLTAAIRAENYSDFGSTFNYKIAGRYSFTENIIARAAHSTGFRAPSLHQISYSKTSTFFGLVDGVSVAQESGVFSNNSKAAEVLGIPKLKEETSFNLSLGVTAKIPSLNLQLSVDGYQVDIDDRVILTGDFSAGNDPLLIALFKSAAATKARFFSNAIDTRSQGVDIVLSHRVKFSEGMTLSSDLAGTFSKTEAKKGDDGEVKINASELLLEKGLERIYFDQESQLYLEQSVPRMKISLSNTFVKNKLTIYLRNTLFGETTEATTADIFDADLNLVSDAEIGSRYAMANPSASPAKIDEFVQSVNDPFNSPKVITDLSFKYQVSEGFSVTLGANNLLDIYPDKSDSGYRSNGRFVYSRRSPQFSYGGRHLFARVALTLQ